MRCNHVVNAARPSKRPRLRQTLIIASWTASSASSASFSTRIASESSFGRASASSRSSAAPAPVWAAATSSPMSGAARRPANLPRRAGAFLRGGDGSSGGSSASSNLRRVGIATRRPARCGVRHGALALLPLLRMDVVEPVDAGTPGGLPPPPPGPEPRRATRAQRPGDPRLPFDGSPAADVADRAAHGRLRPRDPRRGGAAAGAGGRKHGTCRLLADRDGGRRRCVRRDRAAGRRRSAGVGDAPGPRGRPPRGRAAAGDGQRSAVGRRARRARVAPIRARRRCRRRWYARSRTTSRAP